MSNADQAPACVAYTPEGRQDSQRTTIPTVPPSAIKTDSRARAKCDQACRLTLNGFVPVSDGQGKTTAHDLGGRAVQAWQQARAMATGGCELGWFEPLT